MVRFDHALIAWGGVLAQAVVALPMVLWIRFMGYTPFDAANEVLVLLGFFSLAIAAFNLLPVAPLDGAMAWRIFPEMWARSRKGKRRTTTDWRSYR